MTDFISGIMVATGMALVVFRNMSVSMADAVFTGTCHTSLDTHRMIAMGRILSNSSLALRIASKVVAFIGATVFIYNHKEDIKRAYRYVVHGCWTTY